VSLRKTIPQNSTTVATTIHGDNLCGYGIVHLFTESRKVYEVVLDWAINFELRDSRARPIRDLKTIKALWISRWRLRFFQLKFGTAATHLRTSLRKSELALHDFGVFEVCLLVVCDSFRKPHCNTCNRNAAESRLYGWDAMLLGKQIASPVW